MSESLKHFNEPPQFLIDANVLVAILDESDVLHKKGRLVFEKALQTGAVFLSDIVVNETFSAVARRYERKQKSNQFADFMRRFKKIAADLPILSIYELLPANYNSIMNMMVRHEGRLNFHDCLIVLFLAQVPDVTLVSFDKDFLEVEGLKTCPDVNSK